MYFYDLQKYPIHTMSATPDCKYLFIDCGKELKQYSIPDVKCIKTYSFNLTIGRVITTLDSKHAFVSWGDGHLQQICIKTQKIIKDYPRRHKLISAMALTNDGQSLITGTNDRYLTKISINGKQEKDFGQGTSPKYAKNEIRTI